MTVPTGINDRLEIDFDTIRKNVAEAYNNLVAQLNDGFDGPNLNEYDMRDYIRHEVGVLKKTIGFLLALEAEGYFDSLLSEVKLESLEY